MPRQIFKNLSIATAGPLPGQLTDQGLKRWTELRKGRFSEDFDPDVTHLLCTKEQFNEKGPRVKEALKRGKRFHIVHYDWFEFSAVQDKRLPEREYSMRNILSKQNAARRERAKIEKGKRDGERFANTNLYHIYRDREFFPYQIELNRDDEVSGEFGQKYTLCLWESNAKPHLYWFTAKFLKNKGNSQPKYHRPSPHSGKWRAEMDLFMDFFRIKTGIDWEDRVIKMKTMPSSYFQYTPPSGGKPVGRRLRFDYDYCRQVNAEIRGLVCPPVEEVMATDEEAPGTGPLVIDVDDEMSPPSTESNGDEDAPGEVTEESTGRCEALDEEEGLKSTSQGASASFTEDALTSTSPFSPR
ncbi:hypothetical protein B0T10DRAFT_605968 [Thelonectria olida]|uniref:BRCT domain-containing protein n=1 Tax=Thelonectria olida TaxID=1576542 RepID=A0A9P8W6D7_9HYPO|nr:hypothetical protein B0T10DRAFT_605968 [Thelonectria olida]